MLASSLASGCGEAVDTSAGHRFALPAASDGAGTLVVWANSRDAGDCEESEVVAARLGGEGAPVVLSEGAWAKCTALSSRWLAWEQTGIRKDGLPSAGGTAGDDIYRDADIYGYDLDTGEERVICDARGSQVNPDISGFWVVWTDCRRGADDSDIYGCNLETREGLAVCRDPGKQMNPLLPAD